MTPKLLTFLLFIIASLAGCNDEGLETSANDESTRTAAVPIEEDIDMPLTGGSYEDMLRREDGMVQAVPAIPGMQAPWSGSTNLGNSVTFSPDNNLRQTVLKMDEWGPPEMWTISLAIENPGDWAVAEGGGVNHSYAISAIIEFGSGGSSQVVEVDWQNGTVLSVPANAINVIAQYADIYGIDSEDLDIPENLRISVQLSRGTRPGIYPPTRTIFGGTSKTTTLGAARQFIEIPAFAKTVTIVEPFGGDATSIIRFCDMPRDNLGGQFYGIGNEYAYSTMTDGRVLQIPPGAKFVLFQTDDPPKTATSFYLQFNLAF